MSIAITWLGHSAFLVVLPSGKRVLFDPVARQSELSAGVREGRVAEADSIVILISHGHSDHVGDVDKIARVTDAPVVCVHELSMILQGRGLQNVKGMGIGGTQELAGVRITMTQAIHSGSIDEVVTKIVYAGGATGFILRAPDTPTIYFAGDTGIFGDMKVIAELYKPEIAFLPIGDHYTMGPDTAAIAAKWVGVRQVVPMHWGTFPLLHGTPAQLKQHLAGTKIDVLELKPGETAK